MTALASMVIGITRYGLLAYGLDYEYALLMSLFSAFVTFLVPMSFESASAGVRENPHVMA